LNAKESQGSESDKQLASLVKESMLRELLLISPNQQQIGTTDVVQYGRVHNKSVLIVRTRLNRNFEYDILGVAFRNAPEEPESMELPMPGGNSEARTRRPGASDIELQAELNSPGGTLRNGRKVIEALHSRGLGAGQARVNEALHSIRGKIMQTPAQDHELQAELNSPGGTLRNAPAVQAALYDRGLGAGTQRVNEALQNVRGKIYLTPAQDHELQVELNSPGGTLRNGREVIKALHNRGLGAGTQRVNDALQNVRGRINQTPAQDHELQAELNSPGGTLRNRSAIIDALHNRGLGASKQRVDEKRQEEKLLPPAPDDEMAQQLFNPDGTLRTASAVEVALRARGWKASKDRIDSELLLVRSMGFSQ